MSRPEDAEVMLRLGFEGWACTGSWRCWSGSACAARRTSWRTSSSKGEWTDEVLYAVLDREWRG